MSRLRRPIALAACMLLLPWLAAAQETRPTDSDLKKLIESADHDRDRFEDALDGRFKDSILRGPRGEVNVRRYLDDLQENFKRLKERYAPGYAASEEALTVLRQGTAIDNFMRQQPSSMKGSSEWDRLATTLGTLASAYGTRFPTGPDSAARRINDKEAADAAQKAGNQAKALKDAIGKDKSIAKPQRESLKKEADALAKMCGAVKSRLSGGKPATAEARQMFEATTKLGDAVSNAGASQATLSALGPLRATLVKLQQAFGMITPTQ